MRIANSVGALCNILVEQLRRADLNTGCRVCGRHRQLRSYESPLFV
jgi:hypothetical protein